MFRGLINSIFVLIVAVTLASIDLCLLDSHNSHGTNTSVISEVTANESATENPSEEVPSDPLCPLNCGSHLCQRTLSFVQEVTSFISPQLFAAAVYFLADTALSSTDQEPSFKPPRV